MNIPRIAVFLFIAAAFAHKSSGDTITVVENPLYVTGNGYGSSAHEGQQDIFEHFSLTSASTLNWIGWAGQFSSGSEGINQSSGNFNIYLFRDDPLRLPDNAWAPFYLTRDGLPEQYAFAAFRGQAAAGVGTGIADPLQGGNIKNWATDISAITLEAGNYWISISAAASEGGFFLWNHSAPAGENLAVIGAVSEQNHSSVIVVDCLPEQSSMAFSLKQVPDSGSTLCMLVLSVTAVSALIRRMQSRRN